MANWVWLVPALSIVVLIGAIVAGMGTLFGVLCGLGLIGSVVAAVHHTEVVAHRVGDPFGTMILAVALTVIEVALILSLMLAGGDQAAVLPRDTLYAVVMIIINGVVGLCVLMGGLVHHEQEFRVEGTGAGLAALIAMAALALVLPDFTTSTVAGTLNNSQLVFISITSAALWAVFLFTQTVRHRDYFIPVTNAADADVHAERPTAREAWASFGWLLVALVAVVGLAKLLSPSLELWVEAVGARQAVTGVVIAMVVLAPETWAAVRSARANRLQSSMNLAVGSALASIGLTVPVVALAAIAFDIPVVFGLEPKDLAMLAITLVVSAVTLGTGRTHIMQGAVHLVIFAAFLFFAFVP